jgi:hypothetical protein
VLKPTNRLWCLLLAGPEVLVVYAVLDDNLSWWSKPDLPPGLLLMHCKPWYGRGWQMQEEGRRVTSNIAPTGLLGLLPEVLLHVTRVSCVNWMQSTMLQHLGVSRRKALVTDCLRMLFQIAALTCKVISCRSL